jgi:hypothetical protein
MGGSFGLSLLLFEAAHVEAFVEMGNDAPR